MSLFNPTRGMSRRRALLGMASLGLVPAQAVPKEDPKLAFRFGCDCGQQLVAQVPETGDSLEIECVCHTKWHLKWLRTHFVVKSTDVPRG